MTPTLETERLILRVPRAGDHDIYSAFIRSDRARFMGQETGPIGAWATFSAEIGHWAMFGFGAFALDCKDTGRTLGMVGPFKPQVWPENEIGWFMFEGEGKGYAYEAALATRAWAYETLGWTTAVSYIDHRNTRSIALATRLGAVLDPDAPSIVSDDVVYRHPGPEALQ